MMCNILLFIIFLKMTLTESLNVLTTPKGIIRSGGFPKFPGNSVADASSGSNETRNGSAIAKKSTVFGLSDECGTRTIHFYPKRSAKIVGGNVAPYGAFPWQVEIQIFQYEKNAFEHHCGGAVIGERLILTAAHCTEETQQPYLRLIIGNHDLEVHDMYERTFRLDKVILHPQFRHNGPYSNDIAMIKVKSNSIGGISFNSHVKPICLPKYDEIYTPGTWCSVTGWGVQMPDDLKSIAPVLKAAAVPLLDLDTCRSRDVNGGRHQSILDTMLCAGLLQGKIDACSGDSGGPLACQYNDRFFLAGVVSWGDGCAKKNRPGVYTRVGAYLDWIEETMSDLN